MNVFSTRLIKHLLMTDVVEPNGSEYEKCVRDKKYNYDCNKNLICWIETISDTFSFNPEILSPNMSTAQHISVIITSMRAKSSRRLRELNLRHFLFLKTDVTAMTVDFNTLSKCFLAGPTRKEGAARKTCQRPWRTSCLILGSQALISCCWGLAWLLNYHVNFVTW